MATERDGIKIANVAPERKSLVDEDNIPQQAHCCGKQPCLLV